MIWLKYTKQDLSNNATLLREASILIAMWATVCTDWIQYDNNDYKPEQAIMPYVFKYKGFIAIPVGDLLSPMPEGLSVGKAWAETVREAMLDNFSDPYTDDTHAYIPTDAFGWILSWEQINKFTNGTLLTNKEYMSIINEAEQDINN